MPTDPGEGLAFAVSFLIGVLALMFLLAWLETPSQRRQHASDWLKRRLRTGPPSEVIGRHRGRAQPLSLRRVTAASPTTATCRTASPRAGSPLA